MEVKGIVLPCHYVTELESNGGLNPGSLPGCCLFSSCFLCLRCRIFCYHVLNCFFLASRYFILTVMFLLVYMVDFK